MFGAPIPPDRLYNNLLSILEDIQQATELADRGLLFAPKARNGVQTERYGLLDRLLAGLPKQASLHAPPAAQARWRLARMIDLAR